MVNTKQMIVLWYAGLAAVLALLVYADSTAGQGPEATFPLLPVLACIAIVGGLLFLTFRPSEQVNQRRVFLYAMGPPAAILVLLIAVSGAVKLFTNDNSGSVPEAGPASPAPSDIEVVKPCLRFESRAFRDCKNAVLSGRIRNRSSNPLRSISVEVRLHNAGRSIPFGYSDSNCPGIPPSAPDSAGEVVDGHLFRLGVDVPPKSTRSFSSETGLSAPTMRPPKLWEWSYAVQSVHSSPLFDYDY